MEAKNKVSIPSFCRGGPAWPPASVSEDGRPRRAAPTIIVTPFIIYLVSLLLGLLVGSFLNVCILRIPKGESVVFPRSHCPECGKTIPWYDNIPVLSFLFLKGRCRFCGGRISFQYPWVELLTALLALACAVKFRTPPQAALWFFTFLCPLIVISGIDLRHRLIPDKISLPFIAIGVAVHVVAGGFPRWQDALMDSFLGILVGGGALLLVMKTYEWIRKQEGMGLGDVKLAAMIGAFLGWKAILIVFVLSSLMGSVVGIFFMIFGGMGLRSELPYGPFLSLAAALQLFFGRAILRGYFELVQKIFH